MDNDLPKDSFFRIDKEYGNKQRTHDNANKVIVLSQTYNMMKRKIEMIRVFLMDQT